MCLFRKRIVVPALCVGLLFLAACSSSRSAGMADLILTGGFVWDGAGSETSGAGAPTAVAIADGKVLAVGTDEEIERLAERGTERIDLEPLSPHLPRGEAVLPPFFNAHFLLAILVAGVPAPRSRCPADRPSAAHSSPAERGREQARYQPHRDPVKSAPGIGRCVGSIGREQQGLHGRRNRRGGYRLHAVPDRALLESTA